uniref:Tryptophan synthase beta chain-like PALP domain-containing protein n=1 Tax=Fagus sylvatica TaxID=28930 RepID=A0A2N9IRD3_FAGSY
MDANNDVEVPKRSSSFDFLTRKPYVPPHWASHLNPIPSHVFSLGHLPTPIHKWNLPNLPKNTEVWLKRDDLSGMQLSGNKVRKLEFLMADAVAQGADCVITIGGIQSNHCRATAVAAKYLNLDCFLILRTSKVLVDKDPGLTGNLLVERLVGAHVDLVSKEEYAKIGSETLTKILKEKLINEGRRPYVIPVGGSNSLGTWGYIEAIWEIEQQLQTGTGQRKFDDVVVACGSWGMKELNPGCLFWRIPGTANQLSYKALAMVSHGVEETKANKLLVEMRCMIEGLSLVNPKGLAQVVKALVLEPVIYPNPCRETSKGAAHGSRGIRQDASKLVRTPKSDRDALDIPEDGFKDENDDKEDENSMMLNSGGTIAGLSLGSWLSTLKAKVHAFSVCDDTDYFYDFVQGLLDGLEAGVDSRDIVNIQNAKGLGYAINTSEELKFVREIASATGVVLDPVYSGKAAYAMMKDMAENPKKWEGRKILFIHTGGLLGLYDKVEEMASFVGNWRRMDVHEDVPRKDGTGKMF